MPKYELMYIIGSDTADSEIPKISDEVKTYVESQKGTVDKLEDLGKKKLAYPIKHSKTGHYQLVNFTADAQASGEIEHKIRTHPGIIRHLILNMEEALARLEKDRVAQAKLKLLRPKLAEAKEEKPVRAKTFEKPVKTGVKKIQIDLDAEIEKALESEDLK